MSRTSSGDAGKLPTSCAAARDDSPSGRARDRSALPGASPSRLRLADRRDHRDDQRRAEHAGDVGRADLRDGPRLGQAREHRLAGQRRPDARRPQARPHDRHLHARAPAARRRATTGRIRRADEEARESGMAQSGKTSASRSLTPTLAASSRPCIEPSSRRCAGRSTWGAGSRRGARHDAHVAVGHHVELMMRCPPGRARIHSARARSASSIRSRSSASAQRVRLRPRRRC